jgi:hypothetical protein
MHAHLSTAPDFQVARFDASPDNAWSDSPYYLGVSCYWDLPVAVVIYELSAEKISARAGSRFQRPHASRALRTALAQSLVEL